MHKVKLIRQHGKHLVHEVQKVHREITEHLVMICVSGLTLLHLKSRRSKSGYFTNTLSAQKRGALTFGKVLNDEPWHLVGV
jgi:hypothetical protein